MEWRIFISRLLFPTVLLAGLISLGGCESSGDERTARHVLQLQANAPPAAHEWHHYLGDKDSSQASPLSQITKENVSELTEAWRYDAGGAGDYDTQVPTNPLIVKGVLYGLAANKNLFALNAATGEEIWVHPFERPSEGKGAGRGITYWEGTLADGTMAQRILVGIGHQLFAVDALTGKLVSSFANGGYVDLREGLDRPVEEVSVSANSPGTVYRDLLLLGFATSEYYGATPGYIRAYHIPSGALHWTFRTIPRTGEFGADTWPAKNRDTLGGANAWTGITLDEERGIAFIPTGSAAYDFYGADREGDNLFANSLIALNAESGERLWHYQVVRHDLWDRDLPSPPNLVTVKRNGKQVPAVALATKTGHLFVFHRETGEPLFPIEEVPVHGEGLPGEHPASSQPLPTQPPPFTQQHFEITNRTPEAFNYIERLTREMITSWSYVAPSERNTVLYPGIDGGASWGGQAWDADSGLLFVNATEIPYHFAMHPVGSPVDEYSLEQGYNILCAGCHGANREGNSDAFPSLKDIGDRYWPWETYQIISEGRGRMPALKSQPPWVRAALAWYLHFGADDAESVQGNQPLENISGYLFNGYNRLLDGDQLPGSKPPWGSLSAIDLNRGEIAWKIPLGDYPQTLALGLKGLGAENYGGPVVTAGGLVFIAATPDSSLRAFDKMTGNLLWETTLPAAGFATPSVYEADGQQFIVIAAGGGKMELPSGSSYIAYALPHENTAVAD